MRLLPSTQKATCVTPFSRGLEFYRVFRCVSVWACIWFYTIAPVEPFALFSGDVSSVRIALAGLVQDSSSGRVARVGSAMFLHNRSRSVTLNRRIRDREDC